MVEAGGWRYREPRYRKTYRKARRRVIEIYGGVAADDPSCEQPQAHHIIPLIEGGSNKKANLIPLSETAHDWVHERMEGRTELSFREYRDQNHSESK